MPDGGFRLPVQELDSGGIVRLIHPRDEGWVKAHWGEVEALLLRDDRWWKAERTLGDYFERFRSGRMHLWALERGTKLRGVMFTRFNDFPTGLRSISANIVAGDGWIEAFGEITATTEWARACGATLSVMGGRPGWERALKPLGFGDPRIYVRRDISQPLEAAP